METFVLVVKILGAVAFSVEILLYVLITCGLPLASLTLGGKYRVLPRDARGVFLYSLFIQGLALVVLFMASGFLSSPVPIPLIKCASGFFALYLLFSSLKSFFSESLGERAVIFPLSLLASFGFIASALF